MSDSTLSQFLSSFDPLPFDLDTAQISSGKKLHMYKFMYEHGVKNGNMMFLPYDHGLEHGPSDFFTHPESADPQFILELAKQADFSAVVFQIGLAEKYWQKKEYKDIPLVLKLNGKTNIPDDSTPLSPLTASVSDAMLLGADAVGYTLYVGSARQEEDLLQLKEVRKQAFEAHLPLIVWAYPRGKYVGEKGGKDSLEMISYAARTALELGADMVKLNLPKKSHDTFNGENIYSHFTEEEMIKWILYCVGNIPVLLSGGEKTEDASILEKISLAKKLNVSGLIFGRALWQRSFSDALSFSMRVKELLTTPV